MAEVSEATEPTRTRAPRNRGPRRSGSGRGGGGRGSAIEQPAASDEEPKEPREVILSPPVPASMIGTTASGKICDVVKRGRGQFGFIFIGEGSRSETPRIYFSFKDYSDTSFPPRRGYLVEFECAEDEAKRAYACNVRLTADGLKEATERDLKYQSNPENKKESTGERRVRKPRKDFGEGRSVVLKVTCEGKSESKQVTADVTQSIGDEWQIKFPSAPSHAIEMVCSRT